MEEGGGGMGVGWRGGGGGGGEWERERGVSLGLRRPAAQVWVKRQTLIVTKNVP